MVIRIAFAFLLVCSCFSIGHVCAQGGPGQNSGRELKFNRGEPDSFMSRMLNFDAELNIWLLGVDYPKSANEDAIKKLKLCFEERRKARVVNKKPLLAIVRAEHLADGQNIPPKILDKMFGELPAKLPDDKQRQELLSEYFRAEIEAEILLSDQIIELLTPSEQFEFLAKPALFDAFLAHPIGQFYLELSDEQKSSAKKQFQVRKSLEVQRLRSADQSKLAEKIREEAESGKRNINLTVPMPSSQEIRARMKLLAVLDKHQLEKFLRLSRTIKSDQGVADWFGTLKGETQSIAKEIFAEYAK